MSKTVNIDINRLPAPTWNKLKLNGETVENVSLDGNTTAKIAENGGLTVSERSFTGRNGEADALFETFGITEKVIETGVNVKAAEPAVIDLTYADGERSGAAFYIEAGANSSSSIIFRLLSGKADKGTAALKIRLRLEEGAAVHVSIVNLLGGAFTLIQNLEADEEKDASLALTTVSLGAEEAYLGATAALHGKGASLDSHTAYILENSGRIDMNYTANHFGKATDSNIKTAGVVKENGYKVSRQTINFISGCSGSKGNESEEALLLDENVVNKSVPLILCTEEDVEGAHGATIGQLDETLMFYLESRGLDKAEIYQMLSRAKIEEAASRIDSAATVQMIKERLGDTEEEQ